MGDLEEAERRAHSEYMKLQGRMAWSTPDREYWFLRREIPKAYQRWMEARENLKSVNGVEDGTLN